MIGFYEVLVQALLLELERARDENHFISHATIAIVPNPVRVSRLLYALNNAIDAAAVLWSQRLIDSSHCAQWQVARPTNYGLFPHQIDPQLSGPDSR